MRPLRPALICGIALAVVACTTAPAHAALSSFDLPAAALSPHVAVDDTGRGHFVWQELRSGNLDVVYCRIPRGATTCDARHEWALQGNSTDEPYPVSVAVRRTEPGAPIEVVVLAERVRFSGETDRADLARSQDGGTTFGTPRDVADASPVSLRTPVTFGPAEFQASWLRQSASASDQLQLVRTNLATGGGTASQTLAQPINSVFQGPTSLAYVDPFTPAIAWSDPFATSGLPPADAQARFRIYSGAGDLLQSASWNAATSFGPNTAAPLLASGPRGTFALVFRRSAADRGTYGRFEVRRYRPAERDFGAADSGVPVSPDNTARFPEGQPYDPRSAAFAQDAEGRLHAAWIGPGPGDLDQRRLRYTYSEDSGATWHAVDSTDFGSLTGSSQGTLRLAVGRDGGGFLTVYDDPRDPSEPRDVFVIAPLASEPPPGGGGGGAGSEGGGAGGDQAGGAPDAPPAAGPPVQVCGSVTIGKAIAMPTESCFVRTGNVYSTDGDVRINGIDYVTPGQQGANAGGLSALSALPRFRVDPRAGGLRQLAGGPRIVLDAAARTLDSEGTVLTQLGGETLDSGKLDLKIPTGSDTVLQGLNKFAELVPDFLGFQVVGTGKVNLKPNGVAEIPVNFKLPDFFGDVRGDVTLRAVHPTGIRVTGMRISAPEAKLGLLRLRNLVVTYSDDETSGALFSGESDFLLPPEYDEDPLVRASFKFLKGAFHEAGGSFSFPQPLDIFPPFAYLESLGFRFGVDPIRFNAGASFIGGPKIPVINKAALRLDALPPNGLYAEFGDPAVFSFSGRLELADVEVGQGFIRYSTDGLLTFGGRLMQQWPAISPVPVVSIDGGVSDGFVDLTNGRFNGVLTADSCFTYVCTGVSGVVSSKGMAACGRAFFGVKTEDAFGFDVGASAAVGFGYTWGAGSPELLGDFKLLDSGAQCDYGPWIEPVPPAAGAQAAQAGPTEIDVPAGQRALRIAALGEGGVPRVALIGPDGRRLEAVAVDAPVADDRAALIPIPQENGVLVLLRNPPAGRWRVEALPDSVPLLGVKRSMVLPPPSVRVRVLRGLEEHERRLSYRISPVPGQRVVLREQTAGGGGAVIGEARGRRGEIEFLPFNGPGGARQIIAAVESYGLPRQEIVVATYRAPARRRLARPATVQVRRERGRLVARWTGVPGARSYETLLKLNDGTGEMHTTRGRHVVVRNVDRATFGTFTVRAVDRTAHGGRRAIVRLRRPRAQRRRTNRSG